LRRTKEKKIGGRRRALLLIQQKKKSAYLTIPSKDFAKNTIVRKGEEKKKNDHSYGRVIGHVRRGGRRSAKSFFFNKAKNLGRKRERKGKKGKAGPSTPNHGVRER